jgi:hypothetical protein
MRTLTIPHYSATNAQVEAVKQQSMARYGIPYAEAQHNAQQSLEADPHPASRHTNPGTQEIPALEIVTA